MSFGPARVTFYYLPGTILAQHCDVFYNYRTTQNHVGLSFQCDELMRTYMAIAPIFNHLLVLFWLQHQSHFPEKCESPLKDVAAKI